MRLTSKVRSMYGPPSPIIFVGRPLALRSQQPAVPLMA